MMSGYESLRQSAAWIDLSDRGKIRVAGEDRARLLHAMSTNHVQGLRSGDGQYTFFLTAQGRILGDAYLYNLGDSLLLDTEPETAAKLRDHLDKYIIADDVTLEDETANWFVAGIEGPESEAAVTALGFSVPETQYGVLEQDGQLVTKVAHAAEPGYRLFVPVSQKPELRAKLAAAHIPEVSPEEARIVRLESGKPRYGEDITERFLVQETQALHAVHFTKGCYVGQEIVERVRSRGQVHRLLMPIRIQSSTAPPPGTKLTLDGKNVAEITSAVYSPAFGEVVALAYVRTEVADTKPVLTLEGSEPPVQAYLTNVA